MRFSLRLRSGNANGGGAEATTNKTIKPKTPTFRLEFSYKILPIKLSFSMVRQTSTLLMYLSL